MHKRLLQLIKDNANRTVSALKAEVTGDVVAIYLYDVIDSWFGVSAADITQLLLAHSDKTIHLHINSPGGDVFEGRAMATAIAQHGDVHAKIDSLAASAATYVALAAQTVEIASGAFFMIHNAWTFTYGNKADLLAMAALLDKIDGTIVADYAKKTGMSAEEIAALMAAETWYTGQEALDAGFVDGILAGTETTAPANDAWNLAAYQNTPKALISPPNPSDSDIQTQQVEANRRRLRLLELA